MIPFLKLGGCVLDQGVCFLLTKKSNVKLQHSLFFLLQLLRQVNFLLSYFYVSRIVEVAEFENGQVLAT